MARVGVVVLLAGCLASTAFAAAAPRLTASGTVAALSTRSITVHGRSCRITSASPPRSVLRLYFVGASVTIACRNGILLAIGTKNAAPSINEQGKAPSNPYAHNASVTLYTAGDSTGTMVLGLEGSFAVTGLGNSTITAGAGLVSLTCAVGSGSPDLTSVGIGTQLKSMSCRNGLLTEIAAASD